MNPTTIQRLYRDRLSLFTDLYQLTMAYGYWKNGIYNQPAVFHLFFRNNPFDRNYALTAGLELVIDYLKHLHFAPDDIQYLGGLRGADGQSLFDESFLNHLQRLDFQCDIDAIPEGTPVFAHTPLIRVKGPLLQAQLIETALLNIVNFSTLIATKASRIVQAAGSDSVLEFGLRRAQGIDGGVTASRSAYIGGCNATSNLLAGKLYGIPVKGTHAHSWVMAFESEALAFEKYAEVMPNNCIFLVDTYDTRQGVLHAIEVGKKLRKKGFDLLGIRLDSGDLAALSIEARQLLDKAGFAQCAIAASNDLDEYRIRELKAAGAQIDIWGVGTRLSTAYDQPALGGVYKLAALQQKDGTWDYKVKLSEQAAKTSNPGIQQVRRRYAHGKIIGDILYDEKLSADKNLEVPDDVANFESEKDLLVPILRKGKLVYDLPKISDIRQNALDQLSQLGSDAITLCLEKQLEALKLQFIRDFEEAK